MTSRKVFKASLFFTAITVLTILSFFFYFDTSHTVSADTVSSANYAGISNFAPQPGNFRPYANNAPWNLKLPENPQSIDSSLTPNVQLYAEH